MSGRVHNLRWQLQNQRIPRRWLFGITVGAAVLGMARGAWVAGRPAAGSEAHPQRAGPTELQRMLALVPAPPLLNLEQGVWFVDSGRQRQITGFGDINSPQALAALSQDEIRRFGLVAAAPRADASGGPGLFTDRPRRWHETFGFDAWLVDREIWTGLPPRRWARLEGRIDGVAVTALLLTHDYRSTQYAGRTVLTLSDNLADVRGRPGQEVWSLSAGTIRRVVAEDQVVIASGTVELMEAGIDIEAGSRPSLAADADYAALAEVLGPVVGAVLLPGEALTAALAAAAVGTGRAPYPVPLHAYQSTALALRDEPEPQAMLIAIAYRDALEAASDMPVLRERVAGYPLRAAAGPVPLGEVTTVPPPVLIHAGDRAVILLAIPGTDQLSPWLWASLAMARRLDFLAIV